MSEEALNFERPTPGKSIEWFIDVAAKADEVDRADIARGCRLAEYILWIGDTVAPLSVAVLKKPNEAYKNRIFEKAKTSAKSSLYRYEFGYAFTEEPHRRRGRGERLLKESLRLAGSDKVYATARTDNDAIHRLLLRFGFERSGKDYPSERKPGVELALFLR